MFTKTLTLAAVVFLLTCVGLVTDSAAKEPVEAFSLRPMTLKKGVKPEDFEKCLQGLSSLEGLIPGVKFLDMKGDRGVNKGKYIHLWVYDSVKVRDFYFPHEDEDGLWKAWAEASDGLLMRQVEKVSEYLDPTDPSTAGDYTGWVAIKSKANPQRVTIVKEDPSATAFSYRPLTLKESIKSEDFEKFIRGLPSLEGMIPGVQFLFLKGDRGINKGKYIMLWVYDSVKVRDFYFPEDKEDSLWGAWMRASDGLLQRLMQEASEYLAPTDPSTDGDVTGYVAIP